MAPKPSNPVSLYRSASKLKKVIASTSPSPSPSPSPSSSASATSTSAASTSTSTIQGAAIKQCVSSIDVSVTDAIRQRLCSFMLPNEKSGSSSLLKGSSDVSVQTSKLQSSDNFDKSPRNLWRELSSIVYGDDDSYDSSDNKANKASVLGDFFHIPWLLSNPNETITMHRKDISRERKQKWIFKSGQDGRVNWLMTLSKKFGLNATTQILDKCKTETGPEELNALVKCCVQAAMEEENENVASSHIGHAYKIFELMIERGFQIKEETYSPVLLYLIEARMIREFQFFFKFMKDEVAYHRLAYYELLLWMRLDDEDKIQELCYSLSLYDGHDKSSFQESYVLAFYESGRTTDALRLLRTFDITKASSDEGIINIFRCLGKLSLESLAEGFLVALKLNGIGFSRISKIIFEFVTGIPNLLVVDVILKCRNLHTSLDVKPTSKHYEMLIRFCCRASQVYRALEIVDNMVEAGHPLSLPIFHFMLDACVGNCEYNLVRRIHSMLFDYGLEPNRDTFGFMITLIVKLKDFEGAYRMIVDMKTMNINPTASMYNAIMAGFFREKNLRGALRVLKRMEDADLKPDSQTYTYLLNNCNCEEDINKILDEMKCSGIQASKHLYMALINAYAAFGEFEKAKQVVLGKELPLRNMNEIKSVLVSALASNGEMADALNIYKEIKQSNMNLEPKAVISLIEHLQLTSTEGELDRLLQLLDELHDPNYWFDGCTTVISYCVDHHHLRPTIDLLKQLLNIAKKDEVPSESLFDWVFSQIAEKESPDIDFCMNLLKAIKEEINVRPSRQSLDFLLTASLNAKDLTTCFLVWKEYELAALPYNVLSFVRMYQALLALGDYKSAKSILNKIPEDDPHVSAIIKEYNKIYKTTTKANKKKKKKKKESRV